MAQKILKIRIGAHVLNAGLYMALKHHILFATNLPINSESYQRSFSKLLRAAIWSSCVLFNSNMSRFPFLRQLVHLDLLLLRFMMIQWWVPAVLFFFWDFFWRSGLLEYWLQLYVQGHCFGCYLLPGSLGRRSTHPASWLHLSLRGHWPYLLRRYKRGCPGLYLQPIPDAENLPFYSW